MKRLLRWTLALGILLSLVFLVAHPAGWLTERQVAEHFQQQAQREHARIAGAAWLFILLAGDLVLPVPSTLALTAGGAALGWGWGSAVSALGMLTGSAIGYGLCLRFGRRAFSRLVEDGEAERVQGFFRRHGAWALALGRVIPMAPELVCCLAGLVRYPPRRFFRWTIAGIIPFAVIFSWAGDRGIRADEPYWLALAVVIPAAGLAIAKAVAHAAERRGPSADRSGP